MIAVQSGYYLELRVGFLESQSVYFGNLFIELIFSTRDAHRPRSLVNTYGLMNHVLADKYK